MKGARCRLVWTTNFDPLVADGCAKVYGGTGQLTTVAIETGSLGRDAIDEGRWPVEVKIHGDFRSRRLKNTGDELREQDAKLRALLIDSCNRWGLVVVGYSGRDKSVMDTLEAALERKGVFPPASFGCIAARNRPCRASNGFLLPPHTRRSTEVWCGSRISTRRCAISCGSCRT